MEEIMIDSMIRNIKKLGQKRTIEIINADWFILSEEQRKIYRSLFFKAVQKLEREEYHGTI